MIETQVPLIFEMSREGRVGYSFPECDIPTNNIESYIPKEYLREDSINLPEVSEVDVVRHFTALSKLNHGVDSGFYPLGSCTMKYNPKVNEAVAGFDGFKSVHPFEDEACVAGSLELMYNLDKYLSEITGMSRVSLQPAAGAHGEMTGLMIIRAYHESRGDLKRKKIIIPDSAHGTNPASAAVVGLDVVEVKSDERGSVNIEELKKLVNDEVAGLMLTNPNTLGLFEDNIVEIADIIHNAGGLLYYDGANANAIMGICRPGDMGFDVVHLNLHKTFSTPHGGGGPGSGPVGVKEHLVPFLPKPMVEFKAGKYIMDNERPLSIGKVKGFYGNFLVAVKAYAYILSMGFDGLRNASEMAVLNANYVKEKLKAYYNLPYDRHCMHEVVFSAIEQKENGVSALDIAKSLLDFGYHPPTIYFPLIVKEALMIEPTETESRESLDSFINVLVALAEEAKSNPDKLKNAPYSTYVSRLDETKAARTPVLKYSFK